MHQAGLVEKVEQELVGSLDINVMTSDTDARRLRALAPGSRTAVVPNGVDVDFFRPDEATRPVSGRLVFLGPTYMFPNRDAVEFFLAEIWPYVRQARPDVTLSIIGKNLPGDKVLFENQPGVACHGYVSDVRPHFAEAECSVVPLRVGGGTRLKILDAWAMGKAIVSTSIGCEGLYAIDGENILIRDDPAGFAAAVSDVLNDADLRRRLGVNGRKTAEEIYSWRVVGRNLNAIYKDLLTSSTSRVA
jgi:glycosyltransferase involved in cell wall biosynthesis